MKIIEALRTIDVRFPTTVDKGRAAEKLFSKQEELHICSLDLALLLVAMMNRFSHIDTKSFLFEKEDLFNAIVDSTYAQYFAPTQFRTDLFTVDDEQRRADIAEEVKFTLLQNKFTAESLEAILNHQLINPIDVNALGLNRANTVNTGNYVQIQLHGNDVYSFAISQMRINVINEIILINMGEEPIKDAKLVISADPAFLEFSDIEVPLLNPHQPTSIIDFDVKPSLEDLIELSEKAVGTITAKLMIGDQELVSLSHPISFLSYDTWLENYVDGSTALFVTPNDPVVKNVAALVGKELQKISGSPSVDGYQSEDKNVVVNQLKALYDCLYNHGIAYINPPASFEWVGQKIRFPHDVLLHKQGTCLDLAILFAACVENIGLNPFLVLITGHAFVGVFLEDDHFPTMVFDDPSKILEMNSEETNELLLIECTALTAGSTSSFEEACLLGRRHLIGAITDPSTGKADPNFKAIDIGRARTNEYLPLPIMWDDVDRVAVDYEVLKQTKIALARKSYAHTGEKLQLTKAEQNRFDIWEKKLLDLTGRNQLVNYKPEGRGLQIYYYDLNDLYQAFKEEGKRYDLCPCSAKEKPVFELPDATEERYKELKTDFEAKRLNLIFRSKTQFSSLIFFDKQRRKAFEESGSNIFYLAIGFIRYFETEKSMVPHYAPIVLVPINLIRHSKESYSIEGREEPPFLNISIFEYFHQSPTFNMNFDDLLKEDLFSGEDVDIDKILNTVAEKIKRLSRASIVRTAALNIFNFSKAVMWSDVKYRRAELLKNKVVKSIIDGRFVQDKNDSIGSDFDDNNSNPADLAIPLPADSSQIIAIKDCADGKSFILQGPPGTGKSQTITNMIVNAMYHGKTVLFVAEKMAALNVVRNRLNQLCLGNFALEAHSTKADKASLMAQFESRIKLGSTVAGKDYLSMADQIKSERTKLNRVINLLHKNHGLFLSFYEAFVNYLDIDEETPVIRVPDEYVSGLNDLEFRAAADLCDRLSSQIAMNGGYANNPFLMCRNDKCIPGVTKRSLSLELDKYQSALTAFLSALESFNQANDVLVPDNDEVVAVLANLFADERMVDNFLPQFMEIDISAIDAKIQSVCALGIRFEDSIKEIRSQFTNGILSLDAEDLSVQYSAVCKASFFKKKSGIKRIWKNIQGFAKDPSSVSKKDIPSVIAKLEAVTYGERNLRDQLSKLPGVFVVATPLDLRTFDFKSFEAKYAFTKNALVEYSALIEAKLLGKMMGKIQSYSLRNKDQFLSALSALRQVESELKEQHKFDFAYRQDSDLSFRQMIDVVAAMKSRIDYLDGWSALLMTFNECKRHNLGFMLDYIEDQQTLLDNLESIFKKSIYSHIIEKAVIGDEDGSFNSADLKERIDYYKNLLERFKKLTIEETAAKVSSLMPYIGDDSPSSSQKGILNKAVKNKCRGKSIRQLFAEIPDILTKIFPVFLMSPMSCAQYLSPDMPKFDVVIFDEASQMPTSEAIGAIARGKSLVVVGDSMQMPPTAFFQSKGPDDLDVDLEDQDSILDDCDAIDMPSRCLNWHYRSKHESLIRFSNAKFYKNSLVTFPSPNDMVTKVSFVNTHGVYGEKKATNPIEAKEIIKEVERRLRSPELRKRSIGIVTFSVVQQDIIDDMLQDFFAKHKDLEKINNESEEPIIVKNLENIQGDERDVILFSVCYGPDKNGTMHYRFGPINNQGGEKRLNVAISRARYEMIIYASFEPEKLSQMRSASLGARELANFLKYAKDGTDALVVPNGSVVDEKAGFEKDIAAKLEARGYRAKVDVGRSSFRVDVGIINPDNPNEYILGVLCDSYSYEAALTARDRNVVQPTVLGMLGWNVIRVWSFDYFDNPKRVIDQICEMVEDIRKNPDKYQSISEEEQTMEIEYETKEIEQFSFAQPYTPYLEVHPVYGTADDNQVTHRWLIKEILEKEAPISETVLRNRFANAMGALRAGSQIQDAMFSALKGLGAMRNQNYSKTKNFFWMQGQSQQMQFYRVGGEKPRALADIPKEEIFVAIKEVLLNNGPILKGELKSFVARAFEIKSVGHQVDQTIDDCVEFYKSKGELAAVDDGARIALKSQVKK